MKKARVRLTVRRMMLLVALMALMLFVGTRWAERQRQLNKAALARYAASLALYKESDRCFRAREISFGVLHLRSLTVLDAQREMGDPAWADDHLQRMKTAKGLMNKIIPGNEDIDREEYKLIDYAIKEAEYWAMRNRW